MSDDAHTIPDHVAARFDRLINEAEDMRQQAADDLKQIYADLREELRGMGWNGSAVSAEVAAFKSAIVELRLDDAAKAKREEKGERKDDYVSMLSRARARKGKSYAEVKGADPKLIETVVKGVQNAPTESAADTISAPITNPQPTSSPDADKTGEVAPPPASPVAPFNNPRCLNGCHLAHSKDACHECLVAWSHRPKDEQVRLWAEANATEAA